MSSSVIHYALWLPQLFETFNAVTDLKVIIYYLIKEIFVPLRFTNILLY